MGMSRVFRFRHLVFLALGIAMMSVGFGFAAQNTVATSSAGDGQATISGYTVNAVQYTLNATNPQNISSVAFNVSGGEGKPSTVKAKLNAASSTWFDCTSASVSAPYAYSCTTTGATVLDADELRVVAAQ